MDQFFGSRALGDFSGHDFTNHVADVPPVETRERLSRIATLKLAQEIAKILISFLSVSPSVPADEN
ncbi:MAG: hypothetical protein CMM07_18145 [Rhodopirellula sp.]|nr:hypothetical protein [Rhodopirellula sp.]